MIKALRARRIIPFSSHNPLLPISGSTQLFSSLPCFNDAVLVYKETPTPSVISIIPYKDFSKSLLTDASGYSETDATICPALVNAHCHLELSHLYKKTLLGRGFVPWVQSLVTVTHDTQLQKEQLPKLKQAIDALKKHQTAVIGNIATPQQISIISHLLAANIHPVFFFECFGYQFFQHSSFQSSPRSTASINELAFQISQLFPQSIHDSPQNHAGRNSSADVPDACPSDLWRSDAWSFSSIAGHAFYSTPQQTLQTAHEWCAHHNKTFSLHLSEHPDELEFLATGKGALAEALSARVLPEDFHIPHMRPIKYAQECGLLDATTLAVHCVHTTAEERKLLQQTGTNVCLCPRSNQAINVGLPAARSMAEAGVSLCLGTDSLASNHTLNLWDEVRVLMTGSAAQCCKDSESLPANALVRMATHNGAVALKQPRFGRFIPHSSALYAEIPQDIEEQLTFVQQHYSI